MTQKKLKSKTTAIKNNVEIREKIEVKNFYKFNKYIIKCKSVNYSHLMYPLKVYDENHIREHLFS